MGSCITCIRLEGDQQTLTFGVDAAQRRESTYQLGFLDQGAPYFDFLKPLGFRSSVVCVIWCDVGWGGACEGMHFLQSKNARLHN